MDEGHRCPQYLLATPEGGKYRLGEGVRGCGKQGTRRGNRPSHDGRWWERVSRHTFCLAPQMASRSLTRACLRCCSACSRSSKAALIWARASALRSCSCWLMPPTKAMAADSCGSLGRGNSSYRGCLRMPPPNRPFSLETLLPPSRISPP